MPIIGLRNRLNLNHTKLEIWGTAQHEVARGHMSDLGDNLGGWYFASSNVIIVMWPECNRISLHSACSGDLGWVEMRQLNFVVSGPKFTIFCW